jgi:hypothetical protein
MEKSRLIVDEDKVFNACTLVEEIVKHFVSEGQVNKCLMTEKASKASLLLNQAMEEGELVK